MPPIDRSRRDLSIGGIRLIWEVDLHYSLERFPNPDLVVHVQVDGNKPLVGKEQLRRFGAVKSDQPVKFSGNSVEDRPPRPV